MSAASSPLGAGRAQPARALALLAFGVIAFGGVLRLLGITTLELWSDEARWAMHLLEGTGTWFRPVGYMELTRLVLALEIDEPLLRSLSTVTGIALLPLVWVVLRFVVARPAVAVAGTWLFAIHPVAVAMSKEFKPYIVETMLHAALAAFALVYLRDRRTPWLAATLVTAVVAPLFAWTVVFAYPGVFLLLGAATVRGERKNGRHFAAVASACAATLAVLVATFLARLAAKKPATDYWGNKYDVFYVDDGGPLRHALWLLEKTADLAAFPAQLVMPWSSWLVTTVHVVAIALCALGAISIVARRQVVVAALLLAPWLPMLVFNLAGAWPYGMFRTNTFMLFYTGVLVVVGVDALASVPARVPPAMRRPATAALAVAGVVALVLTFPFDVAAFAHKGKGTLTSESAVLAALRRIYEHETSLAFDAPLDAKVAQERAARAAARPAEQAATNDPTAIGDAGRTSPLLVLDGHACTTMRYYREYDGDSAPVLRDWLPAHFTTLCGSYTWKGERGWRATLDGVQGRSFWLVSAKTGWAAATRKRLAKHCETPIVDELVPPSTHIYHCRARAVVEPAPADAARPDADVDDDGVDDERDEQGDGAP